MASVVSSTGVDRPCVIRSFRLTTTEMSEPKQPTKDTSGGCSYGCAMLFIVAGVVWPLLHILGRSYEPEILFIPFVIGAPSFIICHILAMVSISGQPPKTSKGAQALKALWVGVGAAILLLLIAIVIEEATRYFNNTKENKTKVGNGSEAICHVSDVLPRPAGDALWVVFDKQGQLMRVSTRTLQASLGCLSRSTRFVPLTLAVA